MKTLIAFLESNNYVVIHEDENLIWVESDFMAIMITRTKSYTTSYKVVVKVVLDNGVQVNYFKNVTGIKNFLSKKYGLKIDVLTREEEEVFNRIVTTIEDRKHHLTRQLLESKDFVFQGVCQSKIDELNIVGNLVGDIINDSNDK